MAGVNGIEIKVGQVWRTRGGDEAGVVKIDVDPDFPVTTTIGGRESCCGKNGKAWGDIGDVEIDPEDLIELVKDENGFTIWRGGECPVSGDTLVQARFENNHKHEHPVMADELNWAKDPGPKYWCITAYKVVEQAAAPQPADSATLAEETLQALGWTFDGQAWTEQPKADMEFSVPHVTDLPIGMVPNALDVQVGGTHYKDCAIQPIEYIHANKLGFAEGNVVKYITRHRQKHGADDVRKVIHYCQLLLELEYGAGKTEGGA